MSKDLKVVRRNLVQRKSELDADVPNHGFDSALAMAAQAGGIQEAIDVIDKQLESRPKGRKFKLDG